MSTLTILPGKPLGVLQLGHGANSLRSLMLSFSVEAIDDPSLEQRVRGGNMVSAFDFHNDYLPAGISILHVVSPTQLGFRTGGNIKKICDKARTKFGLLPCTQEIVLRAGFHLGRDKEGKVHLSKNEETVEIGLDSPLVLPCDHSFVLKDTEAWWQLRPDGYYTLAPLPFEQGEHCPPDAKLVLWHEDRRKKA